MVKNRYSIVDYRKKIAETVKDENFWNVHDRYKNRSLDELSLIQSQASLPFAVCILNLTGDLNVGMIVRTACTMGASEAILFGRRKYDKRSTVGAQNYMPIARHDGFRGDGETLDTDLFRQIMVDRGYLPSSSSRAERPSRPSTGRASLVAVMS